MCFVLYCEFLQAVSTGTRKDTKENLKITKPLTRSSTVDPSKVPQSGIKPEPEEDKNENVTISDHYKTEKLTKKVSNFNNNFNNNSNNW